MAKPQGISKKWDTPIAEQSRTGPSLANFPHSSSASLWPSWLKLPLALLSLSPGIFDTCKTILYQHLSSSDGGLGVSRIGRDLKATRKSRMQSAIVEVQNTSEKPDDFCCLCFRLFVCFFLYLKATRKSLQSAIVEVHNTSEKPDDFCCLCFSFVCLFFALFESNEKVTAESNS